MCDWDEDLDDINPAYVPGSVYQPEDKSYSRNHQSTDSSRNGGRRPRRGNMYNDRRYQNYSRDESNESFGKIQSYSRRNEGRCNRGSYSHSKESFNNRWDDENNSHNRNSYSRGGRKNYDNSSYRSRFAKNDDDDILNSSGLIDWDKLKEEQEREEKRRFAYLPEVSRKTYHECEEVKAVSKAHADRIRQEKNDITVSRLDQSLKCECPNPVWEFSQAFRPYPHILEKIKAQNFEVPSPIQCQLWPLLMSGHDVVGIAQTGTGKTLAYLLPGFLHIEIQPYFKDPERKGPLLLVLAPTRELAQQIYQESIKFSSKDIKSVCVYGQGNYGEQCRAIRAGIEVVVATPGRLNDFVNKGIVNLEGVSYLVLDEADRMLDMGFQPDILKITANIRKDRQTVLTSATWPKDVEYIANRLMTEAYKVHVGVLDLAAVGTVTQNVIVCEEEDKLPMLLDMLRNLSSDDKVIVFSNKKAMVDHLSVTSLENDINVRVMHGSIDQSDRESALSDLKEGSCRILLATDVASRGLDVSDLTLVVNLDLPKNLEEYVHRSGRTGRAGRTGEVISFVTWSNRGQAQELIEILQRSDQEVPLELERLAERAKRFVANDNRRGRGRGRGGRRNFMDQWT